MSDLLIIGAGPIGLAAGIEAKRAGLQFQILEAGTICQSLVEYPIGMRFYSPADELAIGGYPFPTPHDEKPTRELALTYYRKVASAENLPIRTYQRVVRLEPQAERFAVHAVCALHGDACDLPHALRAGLHGRVGQGATAAGGRRGAAPCADALRRTDTLLAQARADCRVGQLGRRGSHSTRRRRRACVAGGRPTAPGAVQVPTVHPARSATARGREAHYATDRRATFGAFSPTAWSCAARRASRACLWTLC
jgi:hypothetical protein